jgi:hypothetical protein
MRTQLGHSRATGRTALAWSADPAARQGGAGARRTDPHQGSRAGPGRRELTAALATAVLLAELLLAPVAVAVVLVLLAIGRISRWHPLWLAGPAASGLCLTLGAGVRASAAGISAWPRMLARAGLLPGRLPHLPAVLAGGMHLLPRQLPLGLLAGTVEAGALLWLTRPGRRLSGAAPASSPCSPAAGRRAWRPGLIAAAHRRASVAALSAGRTVTATGCAVGIEPGTGRRAELSWAEAERGLLVTGEDVAGITHVGLAAACAAMRRRKTVIIADLSGAGRALFSVTATVARSLAVPVRAVPPSGPADAAALGQAMLNREVVCASAVSAVAGLADLLASLRALGLRGDLLAWVHGCEAAGAETLSELVRLAPQAGAALLLSTTSDAMAGRLADVAGTVVAVGPVGPDLAVRLAGVLTADRAGVAQPALASRAVRTDGAGVDTFPDLTASRQQAAAMLTAQPAQALAVLSAGRLVPGCALVPVRLT